MTDPLFLSGQMFDLLPVAMHLEAAKKYGYAGVQLRSTHLSPKTSPEARAEIKGKIAEYGLKVNALSCFVGNFALLDEDACAPAMANALAFVDLAVEVGAPLIRLWPGWVTSSVATAEQLDRAVRWIRETARRAADKGIGLAMEMHHGTLIDNVPSAAQLCREIALPNVGLILDPVNLYQTPADYSAETLVQLKDMIFDVHVKDIIKLVDDSEPGCFAYDFYAGHIGKFTAVVPPEPGDNRFYAHRRIGQGGVDWFAVRNGLRQIGYSGTFTIESVQEDNLRMPGDDLLAKACMEDWQSLEEK